MGLGLALVIAADMLLVETGSPDALCPELSQARKAVAERLGSIETPGGQWVARYTMVHTPDSIMGDFVELTLRDAQGTLRLERKLPLEGESCRTIAHAIALVLDRYFRDLASSARRSRPPEEEERPRAQVVEATRTEQAEQPSDADVRSSATPSPAPEDPAANADSGARDASPWPALGSVRAQRRCLVGGGAGFSLSPESAAIGVRLGAALAASGRVDLSLYFPAGQREELRGSTELDLRGFPLRGSLLLGGSARRISAFAGPEVMLDFEYARTNAVIGASSRVRVVPGVGVSAWLAARLSAELELGLRGSVDLVAPDLTNRITVDDEEVLRPDPVHGFLGLEAVIFLTRED